MDKRLLRMYRKVREASPVMLVGSNATCCLGIARTILQWETLEAAGFVRIVVEDDQEPDFSYLDTWEHVSERTKEQLREEWADNTVVVQCEYRLNESDRWTVGDSIGGCTGYDDPESPFDNCYVSDLMAGTIKALRAALKDRFCGHCGQRAA
jgi:hypothetical protein